MKTFSEFYNRILNESIKNAKLLVQNSKLSQEDLNSIIAVDPTTQKKYVYWIAKQWTEGQINDIDVLRNTIEEWNSFLNKGKTKLKDIYGYKKFADLKAEVDHLNKSGEGLSVKDLESDYEVIRDDNDLLVMVPHTHDASRKLGLSHFAFRDCEGGKDSAWCTTYKAHNHFNDYYYKNNVTFYYVKVRSERIQSELNKTGYGNEYFVVALAVLPEKLKFRAEAAGVGNIDAYDGNDRQFTGDKLNKYLNIIGLK